MATKEDKGSKGKGKKVRESGTVFFYKVPVTFKVRGPLYASSPTTKGGIEMALKKNMPTEAAVAFRASIGEEIKPIEEIRQEMAEGIPTGARAPSTVFRRDKAGRAYLHANYFKGHLRECGDSCSRILNFWGLQDFITRTLFVKPDKLYIDFGNKGWGTFFAPHVRLSTGVQVRQATEKIEEFIESPELTVTLYLLGDPRWDRSLLEQLLRYGSTRGLGPGRGRCESQYTFDLGEFEKVPAVPLDLE